MKVYLYFFCFPDSAIELTKIQEPFSVVFQTSLDCQPLHNLSITSFYNLGNGSNISLNFHLRRNPSERELG